MKASLLASVASAGTDERAAAVSTARVAQGVARDGSVVLRMRPVTRTLRLAPAHPRSDLHVGAHLPCTVGAGPLAP